ncbi:MAG TPA: class I SAM-dependent methyltransferase [Thermoanaerobaculia bacterium]|nr:class I SAM-dependent methyltransferase [Thermoanaerobaculia bacterium]
MNLAPHPPLQEFYGDASRRQSFVRDIFDDSAPWYDRAVAVMSFGSGSRYRRDALNRVGLKAGMRMLDVATGTGVVARAAAEVTNDGEKIVGLDPSFGMLAAGRAKRVFSNVQATSEQLPFADRSFDLITIGFALRHFADLDRVFAECFRVLRPGGRLLILEITTPESRIARALLAAYMGGIVPAAVGLVSLSAKTARLMRYYWATTRDCVRPAAILQAMERAGFDNVSRHVEAGIFSEYSGRV